jgi:hypothetical protein
LCQTSNTLRWGIDQPVESTSTQPACRHFCLVTHDHIARRWDHSKNIPGLAPTQTKTFALSDGEAFESVVRTNHFAIGRD